MKKILDLYFKTSLIIRILIGLAIGIVLGLYLPQASFVTVFGDVFVGALKAVAPVLVFVLVISSLANAGKGIGKRFGTVIMFYIVSTLIAAIVAVIGSFIFKVTIPLVVSMAEQTPPSSLLEVLKNLLNNMTQNPVLSLSTGNYIGILTWAIIFGIALRKLASDGTKSVMSDISDAVSLSIGVIIQFAPFGILGLVFSSINEYGLAIFIDYGKLVLLLVGCMLTVSLLVNPLIALIAMRKNPYPLLFKCLKESGVTAFFTRSSAANIPVNMDLCERLGLEREYYSVAIPLGATINMDGAAITITIMTLAAAFTQGISVDIFSAVILSFLATLGACGASGVAGGSLLLIPMACSLFGISQDVAMQVVSIGFIIGVIQDSLETALNSTGDVFFAAVSEFKDKLKNGEKIEFFEKNNKCSGDK